MTTALDDVSRGTQARRLLLVFLAWKSLLIVLAMACPAGPGYDTSGSILLGDLGEPPSLLDRLALTHLRWDALYFAKAAQRGHVYEQEWAFSWAYSQLLGSVGNYLSGAQEGPLRSYVFAGVALSNVFHLSSVFILYRLARHALGPQQSPKIPFIAALLHVFSPAGLFLSAPYAESLFSTLNFLGMLHYVLARQTASETGTWTVTQDSYMISSGVSFAAATLIRSNGLFSGLIFVYDVAIFFPRFLARQLDVHDARRILVTCTAGGILFVGFFIPQFVAYGEYCSADSIVADARPWCNKWVPSIYSWVQSHYWGVGFLRYWTISNLPLFLIAAPMLWLLSKTSITVLRDLPLRPAPESQAHTSGTTSSKATGLRFCEFPQLAIPQLVLAVAAATNFHVQIINRLSSGYPLWYMVVAGWITNRGATPSSKKDHTYSEWAVRGMLIYAIVQGVLFAGFLPPA